MAITTEEIKALREKTGLSVMECKKALEESNGDMEAAMIVLRKKSSAAAEKKATRALGAGVVSAYIHGSKDIGTLVMLSCETDFVAKNPEFVALAYDIAMHAAATAPEFVSRTEVTEESTKKAREVFEREAEDKPEAMRAQIVEGKMDSYLKEKVLLDQSFIKNPDITIQGLVDAATQKFGERVLISGCTRYSARG